MSPAASISLPSDQRARLGAWWFIGSLVVFFVTSILFYALYAWSRKDDPFRQEPLPISFLLSTLLLVGISVLVQRATYTIRRDRWAKTCGLLVASTALSIAFLAIQILAMLQMLDDTVSAAGNGRGVVGMVIVLAFLHALHVAGGVIALGLVALGAGTGRYDHERHFAVDFAAQYWHFLDIVWVVMLLAFWATTGGF
jgi:cytochrome c oxidase subunit 3